MKWAWCFLIAAGAALGVSAQDTGALTAVNGTRLYVSTKGTGTPILVVHGGPGLNQSYFQPHLDKLSKHYKLVFYDQRASGKSVVSSPDSLSLKFFADDMEALRKQLGVEKIIVLAHSWGTIPAMKFAFAYPDRVQKLILCNPVPLSTEFDTEIRANQAAKGTLRDSTDRSIIIGSREFTSGSPEGYRKLMLLSFRHEFAKADNLTKLGLEIPANFKDASKALGEGLRGDLGEYNYYEDIRKFSFPVLIIHGAAESVPLGACTRMQSVIPHASLLNFRKSGHFAFIEESNKFTSEVSKFIGD